MLQGGLYFGQIASFTAEVAILLGLATDAMYAMVYDLWSAIACGQII